jgi:hypothetical protein
VQGVEAAPHHAQEPLVAARQRNAAIEDAAQQPCPSRIRRRGATVIRERAHHGVEQTTQVSAERLRNLGKTPHLVTRALRCCAAQAGPRQAPGGSHDRGLEQRPSLGIARLPESRQQSPRGFRLRESPGDELLDRAGGAAHVHPGVRKRYLQRGLTGHEASLIDQGHTQGSKTGAQHLLGPGAGQQEGLSQDARALPDALLLEEQDAVAPAGDAHGRHQPGQRPAEDQRIPAPHAVALRGGDRGKTPHQPGAEPGSNRSAGASGALTSISPIR